MTIRIITSCMLFLFTSACAGQQNDDPEAVKTSFQQKYPGENDPDWHTDDNGNFESSFKKDGKSYRADFTPEGKWVETERSVDLEDLPKAVKQRIESDFEGEDITEIEEVQHADKGLFYDVEFKRPGKNLDVEISPEGKVLNKE